MTNPNNPFRHFGFKQRRQRRSTRLWLVTLTTLLLGAGYLFYWLNNINGFAYTNDAYVTGNITPLKAQTSGTVVEVTIDDTQYVQQGQVLAKLDGLQARVTQDNAEANLAETVRQIENQFSQTEMLQQKLLAKQAVIMRNRRDLERYRSVVDAGAVSAQQIEDHELLLREQEAELGLIRAELGGAKALVCGVSPADNPKVLQAAARLRQAYLDLSRQQIIAPVSGYVAKRSLQPGEQVHPDTPLLAIVPLDYLWIEANFLEDELANVQPGQAVKISVDLYGDQTIYHGEVLGLAAGAGNVFGLLPPNNATGNYIHIVERVPVRIGLRADELKAKPLRPGLSAKVQIDTHRPGGSVLQPLTTIPENAYKTDVYDNQLQGVEILIKRIIEANQILHKSDPTIAANC